jgi:hypothetical protein
MPRRKRRFEKELTSKGKAKIAMTDYYINQLHFPLTDHSYNKLFHKPTVMTTYC